MIIKLLSVFSFPPNIQVFRSKALFLSQLEHEKRRIVHDKIHSIFSILFSSILQNRTYMTRQSQTFFIIRKFAWVITKNHFISIFFHTSHLFLSLYTFFVYFIIFLPSQSTSAKCIGIWKTLEIREWVYS